MLWGEIMLKDYYVNPDPIDLKVYNGIYLNLSLLGEAILKFNDYQHQEKEDPYKLIKFVPSRNLSGALAEQFGQMYINRDNNIKKNLHGDGYPDHLPNVAEAIPWITKSNRTSFKNGGYDIKAHLLKEPLLQNVSSSVSASAHHTQTERALIVQWTDENKKTDPYIVGIYYRTDLDTNDWGAVSTVTVTSKTTNCTNLNVNGKRKFLQNWLFIYKKCIIKSSVLRWMPNLATLMGEK